MNALLNLAISILFLIAPPLSAASITIVPVTQTVIVGSVIDAAIVLSDLGEQVAPSLSVFDLTISFDVSLISFSGVTFGDPVSGDQLDLSGLGSFKSITTSLGKADLFELSFDEALVLENSQIASFTLATLSFNALSFGVSALELTTNSLGDAWGNPLIAEITNGNVAINASTKIAEPSTDMLFGLGIMVLFLSTSLAFRNKGNGYA